LSALGWGGTVCILLPTAAVLDDLLAAPGPVTMVARQILESRGCRPKGASATLQVLPPALPVPLGLQGKMPQLFQSSGDCIGNLLDALPYLQQIS